jgi:hypothetical protein
MMELHNGELQNLYASPHIIRVISRSITSIKGIRNPYRILVGKPDGKKPLGRSRCRWEDNNGS